MDHSIAMETLGLNFPGSGEQASKKAAEAKKLGVKLYQKTVALAMEAIEKEKKAEEKAKKTAADNRRKAEALDPRAIFNFAVKEAMEEIKNDAKKGKGSGSAPSARPGGPQPVTITDVHLGAAGLAQYAEL